jgi:hypothetical protein
MNASRNISSLALNIWDLQDEKLKGVGDSVMHIANMRLRGISSNERWQVMELLHKEAITEAYALYLERIMLWKEDEQAQ